MNTTLCSLIIVKYFVKCRSTQTCDENVTLTPYWKQEAKSKTNQNSHNFENCCCKDK